MSGIAAIICLALSSSFAAGQLISADETAEDLAGYLEAGAPALKRLC